MNNVTVHKAMDLLHSVSSPHGFLASAVPTANYHRVWSRDGVICGLAALASKDKRLIDTFKNTLNTLAKYQHELGTIPSNVSIGEEGIEVSYGGLAGRVDAVTWYVIGVCQYAYHQNDISFLEQHKPHILKCFHLLDCWEFNNKHLLYVPLSGNWADEYVTDGYVLYDQLLRMWALRSFNFFDKNSTFSNKIEAIENAISTNFFPNTSGDKFHPKAYEEIQDLEYVPCSFSPSGYKRYYDGFANSLLLLLNLGDKALQNKSIRNAQKIIEDTTLKLLPAFWPPIYESDDYWVLLKNNCKYEFRNYPNEFHNGGSWPMVNGFFGLALKSLGEPNLALEIYQKLNEANSMENYSFYENFNTNTAEPNGVPFCAWSAAATVMLHYSIYSDFKLLTAK